jgi:uncharacterized protein
MTSSATQDSTTQTADPSINTATWWELPVADLEEAKAFYGAVFGWTFTPFMAGYSGINNGSALIGGLFEDKDLATSDGIRIYVNVTDIESTLRAAEQAGGSVRTPRTEVGGDMGWWAELVDPGGRRLGVCSGNPARQAS